MADIDQSVLIDAFVRWGQLKGRPALELIYETAVQNVLTDVQLTFVTFEGASGSASRSASIPPESSSSSTLQIMDGTFASSRAVRTVYLHPLEVKCRAREKPGSHPMPKRNAAVSGYQGESNTFSRGYVYWPQLTTAREIRQVSTVVDKGGHVQARVAYNIAELHHHLACEKLRDLGERPNLGKNAERYLPSSPREQEVQIQFTQRLGLN